MATVKIEWQGKLVEAVSTKDAALITGASRARIQQLLWEGVLPGERTARNWLIPLPEVIKLRDNPPTVGRKRLGTALVKQRLATESKRNKRVKKGA